jgi:hypothetical protein
MKRIVQGIALAALFAVPQPVKAREWYEDYPEAKAAALGAGIGLGIVALQRWMDQPTSKNLFAMANELEKKVKQVEKDVKTINEKNAAPHALKNIDNLIYEIDLITRPTSGRNKTFKMLTKSSITEKKKHDLITITGFEGSVAVTINTEKVRFIINDIRDAAEKVLKQEQERSKKSWFSGSAWKNWWNKSKTTATNNLNQKDDTTSEKSRFMVPSTQLGTVDYKEQDVE